MTSPIQIALLGGGLTGRLMALQLAEQGHTVHLYEAGPMDASESAAWVAAGMITPMAEAIHIDADMVDMGVASLNRWPRILAMLPAQVYFQRAGSLLVWHNTDHSEAQRYSQLLAAHLPPSHQSEITHLDAISLAALEPELAPRFRQGVYLADEGHIDNRHLLNVLGDALTLRGVVCHPHTRVDDAHLPQADLLIDCRGNGAKPALPSLRGVRGEVIRCHAPEVKLHRPVRLLHPRYPLYIVPKPGGHYVIGATEIESDDRSPVSVRSALELLSALYAVHPGFAEARILGMNSHCRPTLPNHRPGISWHAGGSRLGTVRLNGLYRHGYLLAPVVTDAALALVAQRLSGHIPTPETLSTTTAWPQLFTHPAMPWTS